VSSDLRVVTEWEGKGIVKTQGTHDSMPLRGEASSDARTEGKSSKSEKKTARGKRIRSIRSPPHSSDLSVQMGGRRVVAITVKETYNF